MTQSPNSGNGRIDRVEIIRFMVSASAIIDILAYVLAGTALALIFVGVEVPITLALIGPLYDIVATPSRRYAVRWARDVLEAHGYHVHDPIAVNDDCTRRTRIKAAVIDSPRVVPIKVVNPSPQEPLGTRGRHL